MSEEVRQERGVRKTRSGVVISRSGDKAVVVLGERRIPHPIYGKIIRQHEKYHACDDNTCKVGDTVDIVECRPISKTIRWRVVKKAAEGGEGK